MSGTDLAEQPVGHRYRRRVHMRSLAVLAVLASVSAADASAQRRELSLEANPFHGTLGYGWYRSPDRVMGIQVGFGFPQLDRTIVPDDESLLDIMHVGLFMRAKPTRSVALDGRVTIGLAELRGCSGCFPGAMAAVSGGAFWGGRNVKVGMRVTTGVVNDDRHPPEFVLNVTPVALLFTHAW